MFTFQGSAYPKNMVILVDTSGSVKGQTLELLIFAVKSLLDTLDSNDFVQVARFPPPNVDPDDASTRDSAQTESLAIVDCFQDLVQATSANKKLFFDALNGLEPYGMANFKTAFTYAFDTLHRFDQKVEDEAGNGLGACCPNRPNDSRCNKMIMVLTDAITDDPTELLNQRNEDKSVKVFTYAVGLASKDRDKLQVRDRAYRGLSNE